LESELVDDTIHSSLADSEFALPEFLSNDFSTGLGVKKAVADDLTNEFLGTPIVRFGTSLGTVESLTSALEKKRADLEVTLTAIPEFGSSMVNSFQAAFTFDEHSQFSGDFIGIDNGKRTGFTFNVFIGKLKRNHVGFSLGNGMP